MKRILILFAHPALEKSRIHHRLIQAVANMPGVTVHDLYESYPDFDIDVVREQELLTAHEVVVLQHPFYWYSTPALVKQWEDLVLEHGWAYGSTGTALQGKLFLNVITTGGGAATYQPEGLHGFGIREFLIPIERTAVLCRMTYLPPLVFFGTHRLDPAEIERAAGEYHRIIEGLRDQRIDLEAAERYPFLNTDLKRVLPEEVR